MRKRIPSRRGRLHLALVSAFVLTMALGATSAFAQNAEDDEESFDTKFFREMMKELGFQRDKGGIDYRERSPLVVPPSRALPPPRSEASVTSNPAWPKDPDTTKRRQ